MSKDRPESPRTFSEMAKSHWLGWPPRLVGCVALLLFTLPMLITIWNLDQRADSALQESIQHELLGAARSIALVVDPDLHGTFKTPDQEMSEPYVRQITLMEHTKTALDVNGMIKFVYTCIEQNGQIRFVLDTTPTGDADHDGKDDKSHIMELYVQPSATLRSVLTTGIAAVDHAPYHDRWGTFMSAYAPIFNARHQVIAAAGVDIALTVYDLERSSIRDVALLSAVGALCLSFVASFGVAAYHRRLQTSVTQLVTAGEAAMAAARSKADFLAAMSHELRTPMNAVIGMTEMLGDTHLDETQQSFLSTIRRSGESLLNTITDILDFAQPDVRRVGQDRSPAVAKEVIDKLVSQFQPELQSKNLALDVEIHARCQGQFRMDAEHLSQLLRHLLGNAIKFTDKGAITVEVEPETKAGREAFHFTVRDTGIGIAKEQQSQLFQPFFQADGSTTRRHGGTGIGLALCKRICDSMGGRIWMESEPGKGSAFHFVIPVDPVPVAVPQATDCDALIWSQDSMTEMLASLVLEKQGHRARVVRSFDELVREQRTRPAKWMLLDSASIVAEHMGVLNEARMGSKLILLNAEPAKYAGSGFDAVLAQPVKPTDLRRAL